MNDQDKQFMLGAVEGSVNRLMLDAKNELDGRMDHVVWDMQKQERNLLRRLDEIMDRCRELGERIDRLEHEMPARISETTVVEHLD